jgi:hypothetical protein
MSSGHTRCNQRGSDSTALWDSVRDSGDFLGDPLRGTNEIDTSAGHRTSRHIGLSCRIEILRNGDATDFSDTAQCRCTIAIVAGDNHRDKFAPQCFVRDRKKTLLTSGHPLCFDIGFGRILRQECADHAALG